MKLTSNLEVKAFSLDTKDELIKIIESTTSGKRFRIICKSISFK